MASTSPRTSPLQLTPRDLELFESLYRDPKTVEQLFRESQAWSYPFGSLGRLQTRLRGLCRQVDARHRTMQAGFIQRWRYHAATGGASPYYYKLTRDGYAAVFGEETSLPTKRFLDPLSPAREAHAQALADCNVHTFVAARRAGVSVRNFHPDGVYVARLQEDDNAAEQGSRRDTVIPDSAFDLVPPSGQTWTLLQELDRSTEPKTAAMPRHKSWEETIRRYEKLHYLLDGLGQRFRVFLFCTESWTRVRSLLELAASLVENPKRRIFYGIYLPDYLSEPDALTKPIFLDQNLQPSAMLPASEVVFLQKVDAVVAPARADTYYPVPDRQTVAAA